MATVGGRAAAIWLLPSPPPLHHITLPNPLRIAVLCPTAACSVSGRLLLLPFRPCPIRVRPPATSRVTPCTFPSVSLQLPSVCTPHNPSNDSFVAPSCTSQPDPLLSHLHHPHLPPPGANLPIPPAEPTPPFTTSILPSPSSVYPVLHTSATCVVMCCVTGPARCLLYEWLLLSLDAQAAKLQAHAAALLRDGLQPALHLASPLALLQQEGA